MDKEQKQELPFELIVGEKTGEIHSGDVPVRWCISTEMVAQMERDGVKDPHVLLCSADKNGNEMQRQVVPVSELRTYVRFTKAGEMLLHGWIVDAATFKSMDKKNGRKYLSKLYLDKHGNEYDRAIVYGDERFRDYQVGKCVVEGSGTTIGVTIPEGVFGKEPHPAVKWFVNLWHGRDKVVDQCHFRRRAILAFTLKWIPVLTYAVGWTAIRTILAFIVCACGYPQAVKWKMIPRVFDFADVNYLFHNNVNPPDNIFFFRVKVGETSAGWPITAPVFFLLPVLPIFTILLWGLISIGEPAGALATAIMVIGTVTGIMFIGNLVSAALVALSQTTFMDKIFNKFHKFDMWMANNNFWPNTLLVLGGISVVVFIAAVVVLWKIMLIAIAIGAVAAGAMFVFTKLADWIVGSPDMNDYTEIRELLCPKDELNRDLDEIPSKYKTVRLYFLDFKNKVCKPMQM